ncbi:MAG: YoaK family protein [Polyangiaceae bacterium]
MTTKLAQVRRAAAVHQGSVLPVRNIDPSRSPGSPLPDPRKSQPSFNPPSRPSMVPSHAIGSILPGRSMYLHSALLSGVAGYVDAAGFASLIGLFPAHLTGEIVGDAIALTSGHPAEHPTRLWILPVFVFSVATATLVARMLRRNGRRALTGLLALVTAGLLLFSLSDALARMLHESWHVHVLLGGASAVAAMGFQNTLMRESMTGSCPTTVMTGNLTHVVIELVDQLFSRLARPHKRDRRPRSRLLPVASALCAFVTCAVMGGFLARFFGSLSVLLPTALTATMTYRAWREDRRQLALSPPASGMSPAPLPRFDVWPDSLAPAEQAEAAVPPKLVLGGTLGPNTTGPRTPREVERPPMKRTISGTHLKTGLLKDE